MQIDQPAKNFAEELLKSKNILLETDARDLKNLPSGQPFLCIANQALDEVDDLVLTTILANRDLPFKIITRDKKNAEKFPEQYLLLDFNILQWEDYVKAIFKTLSNAKNSGVAYGLVLHFTDRSLDTPVRQQFLNQLMKVVMRAEIPVVPMRLKTPFPDFVRPGLGGRLVHLGRKEPFRLKVRIGSPISVAEQSKFGSPKDFRRYVQSRIYSLGSALEVKPFFLKNLFKKPEQPEEAIAQAIDPQLIASEMANLPGDCLIASQGEFDIFVVEAKDIPNTLQEIGRLREMTFRTVGEGTGKALDLDEYDIYYRQLLLWDREAQRIAGGYRMGVGEEIFNRYGAAGFYISSLFKIKEGFHSIMQKAVELGRSYIVPEYQRKRLPLFLLWKGILFFLLKNPQYRYLYGPVSISKFYTDISRGLIVAFIKKHFYRHDLAQFLKPRKPFKAKVDKVDIEMLTNNLDEKLQSLDSLIEDIEPAHIRIPVLVRQYLKLNARFISFNVDPNFSDVLDGFIILDLTDVPMEMLEALKKEGSLQ